MQEKESHGLYAHAFFMANKLDVPKLQCGIVIVEVDQNFKKFRLSALQ